MSLRPSLRTAGTTNNFYIEREKGMFEEIKSLLASQLGIDAEMITEESDIEEDLGADSLDVVEMLATLEEEHGIYIADEDVLAMRTVGDVLAYLETSAL